MFCVDIKYITRFICNKKNNSLSTGVENLLMNSDLKKYLQYLRFLFGIYTKNV